MAIFINFIISQLDISIYLIMATIIELIFPNRAIFVTASFSRLRDVRYPVANLFYLMTLLLIG